MTDEATPPPGPDDKPEEPSPRASDGVPQPDLQQPQPQPAREEEAPPEPSAKRAPDKPVEEVAPAPAAASASQPNYGFLAVVAFVSLVADLATKAWAKGRLEDVKAYDERHIDVIPKFVSLVFARNKGGAWGLLQDQPESIRRPFFLGVSALAILFIVSLYRRLSPEQTALKWGLPLVLGGALGNLINRIQYNYVVDFIDVYFIDSSGKGHHWPTFNVADIAICVGVGLMAIDMFTSRRPPAHAGAGAPSYAPGALSYAPGAPDAPGALDAPHAQAPEEPAERAEPDVAAPPSVPLEEAPRPAEKASKGT